MKKIIIFLFSILSITNFLYSQKLPFKIGKITDEEFNRKIPAEFNDAPAVFLFDYGKIFFDTQGNDPNLFVFYERHIRIKIQNEKGKKWGKLIIPFFDLTKDGYQGLPVFSCKAISYRKKNKDIIKHKVKRKDIKYKTIDGNFIKAIIEIPDVEPGTIIDYYYQIATLDLLNPDDWDFQREVPVLHSEFKVAIPECFQYHIELKNMDTIDVNEYNQQVQQLQWKGIARRYGRYYKIQKSEPVHTNVYHFIKKNSFPTKRYENFNGVDKNNMRLEMHLLNAKRCNMEISSSGYSNWEELSRNLILTLDEDYYDLDKTQRRAMNYPSGYIVYNLTDWNDFSQNLLARHDFGLALLNHFNYKNTLDSIIEGSENEFDKANRIYNYVKNNFTWNGVYKPILNKKYARNQTKPGKVTQFFNNMTNFQNKCLSTPFEEKKGTNAEINLILTYLLRKANIIANPVLMSTRDNGTINKNIPSIKQFNHTIVQTYINDNTYFLDATDSVNDFGILPVKDLNGEGIIIKNPEPVWIKIQNNPVSMVNVNAKLKIDKNNITGILKVETVGTDSVRIIQENKNSYFIHEILNNFFRENTDIEISNQNTDSTIFNIYKKGKIAIVPVYFHEFNKNPFPEENRYAAIDFIYPRIYKSNFTINFNREIQSKNFNNTVHFSTTNNLCEFKLTSKSENNSLNIKAILAIKSTYFTINEYHEIRDFFRKLEETISQKIVF